MRRNDPTPAGEVQAGVQTWAVVVIGLVALATLLGLLGVAWLAAAR